MNETRKSLAILMWAAGVSLPSQDCPNEDDHTWECCDKLFDLCVWCDARVKCKH